MKVTLTGDIEEKNSKILTELFLEDIIELVEVKECDYLVVGDNAPNDIFAEVIFDKEKNVQIMSDNQFNSLLKDTLPEFFL